MEKTQECEGKDKTQALSIKLNLITRQSHVAYFAVAINSMSFLYITWEEAFRFNAVVWAALVNLLTLVRFLFLRKWQKKNLKTLDDLKRQHVIIIIGSCLSGCFWGYLGWLYYQSASALSQSFALFLLSGMTAGAVAAYSSSLPVLCAYLIPALIPFVVCSFFSSDHLDVAMGFVTFLYLGLMLKMGRNANLSTIETINLTNENEILAAERRAASRLLANVSHEIRTPLAAINGYVDLMQMEAKDNENAESLAVIKRSSEHLLGIVDDLLDLSLLHAGKAQVHYTWFSPITEINDVLQLSEPRNTNKIKINIQKDSFVPEKIYSDPKIFRQIFINLLTNSLKFTPQGFIRVLVRMEPGNRRQNLTIDVEDTGIGIEPSLMPRIFQPFARGSDSYVQSKRGSGLGLALSKDLSHLLDGDLILKKTSVGLGTTFSFSVNAGLHQRIIAPQGNFNNHSPTDLIGLSDRLKGLSFLIVDDAPDLLSLIKRILSRYDIQVETKCNGQEAVEEASRKSFDLILMDLSMPVLDGCQATEHLRSIGYSKPILALTAHTSEEHHRRCIEAGFDGFLKKPFDRLELLQTIAFWISPARTTMGTKFEDEIGSDEPGRSAFTTKHRM